MDFFTQYSGGLGLPGEIRQKGKKITQTAVQPVGATCGRPSDLRNRQIAGDQRSPLRLSIKYTL